MKHKNRKIWFECIPFLVGKNNSKFTFFNFFCFLIIIFEFLKCCIDSEFNWCSFQTICNSLKCLVIKIYQFIDSNVFHLWPLFEQIFLSTKFYSRPWKRVLILFLEKILFSGLWAGWIFLSRKFYSRPWNRVLIFFSRNFYSRAYERDEFFLSRKFYSRPWNRVLIFFLEKF